MKAHRGRENGPCAHFFVLRVLVDKKLTVIQTSDAKLQQIIEPIVTAMGYDLWGFSFNSQRHRSYLRIFIDKQEGVTLDDCAMVSNHLSGVLDVEDPITGPYTLEISSPGVDRPLLKQEHYERYIGSKIKVKLKWQIEGRRQFTGKLRGLSDGNIVVEQDGNHFSLSMEAVERANLVPEY